MLITVNGENQETPPHTTLTALLNRLDIAPDRIAVEINLTVIRREDYHKALLHEGDRIEIISFIGGGEHAA